MQKEDLEQIEQPIHLDGVKALIFSTGLAREISEVPDILHYIFDVEDVEYWAIEREVMENSRNKVTIAPSTNLIPPFKLD